MAALDPILLARSRKLYLALSFIYNFSILFPKLAILCLYQRVFSTRYYRFAIYAIGGIVVLTCTAAQLCTLVICHPFAFMWNRSIPNGSCGDLKAAFRYVSVPNLVTDMFILALPLYGVWHLQTKVIHKIGLTFTFILGCL